MIIVSSLCQSDRPAWYSQIASWSIALLFEVALYGLGIANGITQDAFSILQTAFQTCRISILLALPVIILSRRLERSARDEECSPLLGPDKDSLDGAKPSNADALYGSVTTSDSGLDVGFDDEDDKEEEEERQKHEKRLQESGNWFKYVQLLIRH